MQFVFNAPPPKSIYYIFTNSSISEFFKRNILTPS